MRFLKLLLHVFVVIVTCLSAHTLGLSSGVGDANNVKCIERERRALLQFKHGLVDDYGRLSSWGREEDKSDCCKWSGVRCSNRTGHVTMLHLHDELLGGNISSSLLELRHLNYLDLSGNDFYGSSIPGFIGVLSGLQYLNLSYAKFSGMIPYQLGNLTNLHFLDLSLNYFLNVENLEWLSHLSLLKTLDLSGLYLSKVSNWVEPIAKLPLLIELRLSVCQLSGPFSLPLVNSSHNLIHVDLSRNNLQGMIPDAFGNMISLEYLDLSFNQLTDSLPDVSLFSSLRELDLSFNELNGSFSTSFGIPPSLEILDLSWNQIKGSLPHLSSSPSLLKTLYLNGNQLEGVVSEAHFSNLSNLQNLDMSGNSLVLKFSPDWLPPFQLDTLLLSHCKLGHFPKWLQTQDKISQIDISETEISDTVPEWFWDQSPRLQSLNLSHNQIYGKLPDLSSKFFGSVLDLSYNNLEGPIPLLPPNITLLYLSRNMFSGSISFFCNITNFFLVDLSYNLLSGEIPDCWMPMASASVRALNLASNNFSGKIPTSIGNLKTLVTLQLRNNSFTGEIPFSLSNCENLMFIDLGENSLSGVLPEWIGGLSQLILFTARSNQFYGTIPLSICGLSRIQILDLSGNNISGNIPKCLNNISAMSTKENSFSSLVFGYTWSTGYASNYDNTGFLVWKRTEAVFGSTLGLVKGIDLSRNKLTGKIPEEIVDLVGLVTLNLSGNELIGSIPLKIGQLRSLDSLDLSNNHLSGKIPTSLSQISRLSVLDLSNNNFSGKIPLGTQLQSFNASSYMGNPGLCGAPLEEECPVDKLVQDPQNEEDRLITQGFYVSMGLGFVFGFWGVCLTLVLNSSWRHVFFKLSENIEDWFFVTFGVYTARLKRQLQSLG